MIDKIITGELDGEMIWREKTAEEVLLEQIPPLCPLCNDTGQFDTQAGYYITCKCKLNEKAHS